MPVLARISASICLLVVSALPVCASGVRGTVRDPDARPVAGARVTLVSPAGLVAEGATDASGAFAIDAPDGRFRLVVDAPGLRADPVFVTLPADAGTSLDLLLQVSAIAETVVVSAAQVEQPQGAAPIALSVVTAADLERRQAETVAEALGAVPGFEVARNGGRGALTSVFPRGGESDFTLVTVDGTRLNAFGGQFDFSALSVADVERVEVVRGPHSAVFGADAGGAVVHVVTRQGGPVRASAMVEGGGFGTGRVTASSSGGWRRLVFGAATEHSQSDGFTGLAPATGERVSNDDWRFDHASVQLGADVGRTRVRGNARRTSTNRGFPGAFGSNPNATYAAVDRVSRGETTTLAGGASVQHTSGRLQVRGDASALDADGTFVSTYGRTISGTRRVSARGQIDAAPTSRLGLSAGIETFRERASSTYITAESGELVPVDRRAVGSFAEGRLEVTDRLQLSVGVRAESIAREALPSSTFAGRPAMPEDTVVSVNPRAAASMLVHASDGGSTWVRLRASAGTGIRPPDAFEIAYTDNPSLRPERNRGVDAGVELGLLGGGLVADATVFTNAYDDLIVAVGRSFQDASRYLTDNISNARARGVELSLAGRLRRGVEARVSYTGLDTGILAVDGSSGAAPSPFTVGEPLIRRPKHRATADVSWATTRSSAFARLTARSGVLDVDPTYGAFGGKIHAAGYWVADAGASVAIGRHLDVFGRVNNLFDRQYEEALGFPALGRHAIVGVRVAARR